MIFLLVHIFEKIILPWYKDVVYQGIDISGTWVSSLEFECINTEVIMHVKQFGHEIDGTLTLTKCRKKDDTKHSKIFKTTGRFQDGHLILMGNCIDRKLTGHITYLMKICSNGGRFTGSYNWVDTSENEILCRSVSFTREE